MVTTTIDQDKGILSKLPPDIPQETAPAHGRDVLEININALNQIYLEGKTIEIEDIKTLTLKHLRNNGADPNLSESPTKAIVSLQNDRGTSYDIYIMLQNELKAAYTIVRNDEAERLTKGRYNYSQLKTCVEENSKKSTYCKTIKEKVKTLYPMKITEKEPVDLRLGKLNIP